MDFTNAFEGSNGNGKPPGGIGGFDAAEPAPDFSPVPPGIYSARVLRGEYCSTKAGAEAYRIRFEITEGEQAKQTVIRTWTFGPKALSYTKRDLAPFGLTTSAKLLSPFPEAGREYLVRLVVALQKGNDGIERNDIKRIDLLRVVESPAAGSGARRRDHVTCARKLRAWLDEVATEIDTPAYTASFHGFNKLLVSMTDNETLILLTAMLENLSDAATASYIRVTHDDDTKLAHKAHRARRVLADLIEAGDDGGAEELWRKHLTDAGEVLVTNQGDNVIDLLT